jgi:hypothetical protein
MYSLPEIMDMVEGLTGDALARDQKLALVRNIFEFSNESWKNGFECGRTAPYFDGATEED